jgi:hypothetical protein
LQPLERRSKMRELKRLNDYGRALLNSDFLAGHHPIALTPEHTEHVGVEYDYDALRGILDDAMRRIDDGAPMSSMDVELAHRVHQTLTFDRKTASDTGVWHYLTVHELPDFVRHRWGGGGAVSRERFLGSLKRNALARLWWGAELTRRPGGDYSLTRVLFAPGGGQDLYEQVLGHRFSNYPPAAVAFVDIAGRKPRNVIRATSVTLSQMLTTIVLEGLGQGEVNDLVSSVVARVERTASGMDEEDAGA